MNYRCWRHAILFVSLVVVVHICDDSIHVIRAEYVCRKNGMDFGWQRLMQAFSQWLFG